VLLAGGSREQGLAGRRAQRAGRWQESHSSVERHRGRHGWKQTKSNDRGGGAACRGARRNGVGVGTDGSGADPPAADGEQCVAAATNGCGPEPPAADGGTTSRRGCSADGEHRVPDATNASGPEPPTWMGERRRGGGAARKGQAAAAGKEVMGGG
jgi:hypothetical protein